MDKIEISVLNYENQLLESRKQLNNLIYEYNNQNVSSSIINNKISYLQNEIDYMNNQLNILKASLNEQPQPSNIQQQNMPSQRTPSAQPQGAVPKTPNVQPQYIAPHQQALNMQKQNMTPQQAAPNIQPQNVQPKPKDLENIIGKSWMGIFASVLIFISFILFATLLAPFITDTIKMIAMYIVSILFTAFGLIKLKKHNNKLYLAISSCGVGAIYISLLLTNLYFKAIGDIALYIFILVWAVFVCYLSKWRDRVFQIIGQCGITIALLFGIILCVETGDITKLFLLSLFFVVTAAIFYVSNYSREFHKNIINNIFNVVNVFQLLVGVIMMPPPGIFNVPPFRAPRGFLSTEDLVEEYLIKATEYIAIVNAISVVVLIFLILQFILFFIAKLKENNIGFGVLTITNTILLMLFIYNITYGEDLNSVRGIIFIVIGCIMLAVTEKKFGRRKDDGKALMQYFVVPLFILSVYMVSFFQNHIGLSFIMILFILLGYYTNDYIYKYESLIMAVVYCFINMKYPIEHFCLGLLFFALLAVLMYIKKEQYNRTFKLFSYIIGFIFICVDFTRVIVDINVSGDVETTIMLTVVAILNVLAMKSRFIKDFQTMQVEKASVNITRTINALLMTFSLLAVIDVDNEVCHCILILLAIMIFMVNTKNLIEQNKGMLPGIYIGIKLTILLVTILYSFDAANYIISVSAFLFAIVSIVIGFKFSVKSFRIYGLILSLISVAKLILVDISYDNTLGHALSFFVCGLLCFVISTIYHLIDKRMQDK